MEGVLLVNFSSENCWEEVRAADHSGIRFVPNSSTSFANSIMLNLERCKNWLDSCCILVDIDGN